MRHRFLLLAFVAACASPVTGTPGDDAPSEGTPNAVLEEFWSTLDREYAVFDVRLTTTTWKEAGDAARARIVDGITDAELYDVLLDMAKTLDDGHTTLIAESLGRDEDAEVNVYPNYAAVETAEDIVEENYLDDDFETGANDEISWGTIGDVGYISITSMDELSTADDEDADVAAARTAMQSAIADMNAAHVRGVVVDVRANEGGYDTVSLEIARWFAGARVVAWNEQVRNGPGHTDFAAPVPTYVEAAPANGFTGPVVVLTSHGTYSAAETFLLAMRVRAHVTIAGERSSGHLSDMIDGTLPNGWEYTYSGERYLAADGQLYEVTGIPVNIPIALDVAKLAAGTDVMLEAAIASLP